MKNILVLIALIALIAVVAQPVAAQVEVKDFNYELVASSKSGKGLRDGSATFYWKIWQSPKLWAPVDTSSVFNMSELIVGDTVCVPYIKSNTATQPYNAAIKIQWGQSGNGTVVWKPAVTLDSIVRIGTLLVPPTPATGKDSVFVGRNIHHDWMTSGKGSDCFRLLIAKDTTSAADANPGTSNGTGTYELGVIRRSYKGKL